MTTTTKDRLVKQYRELENRIEDSAFSATWELADWLAKNVPNNGRGGSNTARQVLTTADLAAEGIRSRSYLNDIRKVAVDTAPNRMPEVSVRVYVEALRGRTLDEANAYLAKQGTKLRDVSGPMESPAALSKQIDKRSKADVIELVELLPHEAKAKLAEALYEAAPDEASDAAFAKFERQKAKAEQEEKELRPRLLKDSRFAETSALIGKGLRSYREALDLMRTVTFNEDERGALLERAEEITVILDWIRSYLTDTTGDFDSQLADILKEDS